jgi:hypothetical protein
MATSAIPRAAKNLLSAFILLTMPVLNGADLSRLSNFAGTYSTNGTVEVTHGKDKPVTGTATLTFTIAPNGKSARLKIGGKLLASDDVENRFSTSLILRGNKRALLTNLAPGFEDRRFARVKYSATSRRITAQADIAFGTVTGKVTILAELQRVQNQTRLSVVQVLTTSELAHPLTWKFSALRTP